MKSHWSELPGPLPTTLDVAIATLAYDSCASSSRSTSLGVSSLLSRNLSMRPFHVSKRWNTLPRIVFSFFSLFSVCTSSVRFCLSAFGFSSVWPNTIIIESMKAPNMTTMPRSLPICFIGTRPMNIIISMTALRSAAVDRFSDIIRGIIPALAHKIYLKALGSAPFSVCSELRICAVDSINAPFAISDG